MRIPNPLLATSSQCQRPPAVSCFMPRPCTAFVVGDSSARQSRLGNDGAFQCHGSRRISTALIRALDLEPSLRYLTPKKSAQVPTRPSLSLVQQLLSQMPGRGCRPPLGPAPVARVRSGSTSSSAGRDLSLIHISEP